MTLLIVCKASTKWYNIISYTHSPTELSNYIDTSTAAQYSPNIETALQVISQLKLESVSLYHMVSEASSYSIQHDRWLLCCKEVTFMF